MNGIVTSICNLGCSPKLKIEQRGLRIGTWNFQGLYSDRKVLEVGEVLPEIHLDIVGSQESWELDTCNSKIYVSGCKWFGKPSEGIKSSEEKVG